MKKAIKAIALVTVLLLALTACGKETFSCGWCGRTVTETPHNMSIAGENMKICSDCYNDLKTAGVGG
jgi:hypothetical protein